MHGQALLLGATSSLHNGLLVGIVRFIMACGVRCGSGKDLMVVHHHDVVNHHRRGDVSGVGGTVIGVDTVVQMLPRPQQVMDICSSYDPQLHRMLSDLELVAPNGVPQQVLQQLITALGLHGIAPAMRLKWGDVGRFNVLSGDKKRDVKHLHSELCEETLASTTGTPSAAMYDG
jgi:hypothetical protein